MELYDSQTNTTTSFSGEELSYVSSAEKDSARWTEITLYKTDGGSYIVFTAGRTLMYHSPPPGGCDHGQRTVVSDDLPKRGSVACPKCTPTHEDELQLGEIIYLETDRTTVRVTHTAKGVWDLLQVKSNDSDVPYLSKIARKVLAQAAQNDEALAVRHIA
jgi:hypothetical protein